METPSNITIISSVKAINILFNQIDHQFTSEQGKDKQLPSKQLNQKISQDLELFQNLLTFLASSSTFILTKLESARNISNTLPARLGPSAKWWNCLNNARKNWQVSLNIKDQPNAPERTSEDPIDPTLSKKRPMLSIFTKLEWVLPQLANSSKSRKKMWSGGADQVSLQKELSPRSSFMRSLEAYLPPK